MDIHIPSLTELAYKARKALTPKNPPFKDKHLIYAAYSRCSCGAGLAYPLSTSPNGYWDCSAILRGEAIPSGQEGSVQHTAQLPFTFYEVKSENQPSAYGATTRPI